MDKLTFIYLNGALVTGLDYFQKTIILEKNAIRTENVYFDLDCIKRFDRIRKNRMIMKEMNEVVSNNDVVMSSSNFTVGDAIVTTGGIIIGSNLPVEITASASRKRNARFDKINKYFVDGAYLRNRYQSYYENVELIDHILDTYKSLLKSDLKADEKDYMHLLSCLIESVEPIKSNHYDEDVKKLLKEYPLS